MCSAVCTHSDISLTMEWCQHTLISDRTPAVLTLYQTAARIRGIEDPRRSRFFVCMYAKLSSRLKTKNKKKTRQWPVIVGLNYYGSFIY